VFASKSQRDGCGGQLLRPARRYNLPAMRRDALHTKVESYLGFTLALLIAVLAFRPFPALAKSGQPKTPVESQTRPTRSSRETIVFTGSSSIAFWETLPDDMKPLSVVNSAFGGAQYTELVDGVQDLVIYYRPAAVVVYAGDNDLVTPSRKTPESVAGEVRQFVDLVHAKLPNTWIYVLSIKPSLARSHAWRKMKECNRLIEEFLRTQSRAQFIDIATPMFDASGDLPRDLFIQDGLHPSAKCYAMWTAIIKPILLKRFASANAFKVPRPGAAAELGLPVLQSSFLGI
jgi:lysophospholipase L1-like esterase